MSKGGSTTSAVTIPEYIEAAAQRNLNKAERISQIGYTPYYGPDVAAFTPMQQAGFQNTADLAGAYGMAAPSSQQDIYGGMGPATTYAGGVQGYSSAPMFEQSLQSLAQNRPGQKSYIDSFFIDPYSGGGSAGNFAPIDYTGYQTNAAAARAGGGDGGGAGAGGGGNYGISDQAADPSLAAQPDPDIFGNTPSNIQNSQQILGTDPSNPNYNNAFQDVYNYQSEQAANDPYGQSTGFGITSDVVAATGGIGAWLPGANEQASSMITNPAAGITNTDMAGTGTQIMNDIGEGITGYAANTIPGQIFLGNSYNTGGANNPIKTPTVQEMIVNAPSGMTYQPDTGSYSGGSDNVYTAPSSGGSGGVFSGGGSDGIGNFGAVGDFFGGIGDAIGVTDYASQTPAPAAPAAPVRPLASPNRPDSSDSGNTSDTGGGKVICAAMNKMGLLPDNIYALDSEFGLKVNREDPMLGDGYRLWALPVSEFIKKDTLGARALRAFLLPLTLAWAKEMAHQMRPDDYKPNYAGKVIMAIGHPTCRAIGHVFLGRLVKKDV